MAEVVVRDREFEKALRRVRRMFQGGPQMLARAQGFFQEELAKASKERRFRLFGFQGDGYLNSGYLEEARQAYKQALQESKVISPADRGEMFQSLLWSYFAAIFFTSSLEAARKMVGVLAKKSFFGKPFLLELLRFCQFRRDWRREVAICEGLIICASIQEDLLDATLQKAIALARGWQTSEAVPILESLIAKRPNHSPAYEWLGGLYLAGGDERAFALLEQAFLLGASSKGFLRDAFIARVVQGEDYKGVESILLQFPDDAQKIRTLFEAFLVNLQPSFFQRFCLEARNFKNQYERTPRASRKNKRFLAHLDEVINAVQRRLSDLERYMVPLAKTYWNYEPEEQVTYYECIRDFEKNLPEEIESFLSLYNGTTQRVDPQEFRNFVYYLVQSRAVVTMIILVMYQFVDILDEVCEVAGRELCTIHFNPQQEKSFLYSPGNPGTITFRGKSFFITDEEGFRKDLIEMTLEQE